MAKSANEDLRDQLATAVADWLRLEAQKGTAMDEWNKRIKKVHQEIVGLSKAIQDGAGVQTHLADLAAPKGEPSATTEAVIASGKPPV